ncbi:MAG: cob(I)yrinic acid a,c-diamide adenosyltransferase [Acidobacteria bacterium]|nr:cob(I)yrinic acid a,c-diamide adenosyltransferase [Acidobacteriota bacterium]
MNNDSVFNEPRLALNRIYTKVGDQGQTHLASGELVPKDSPRLECYGCVDELNAFVGLAASTIDDFLTTCPRLHTLAASLTRVQHELFNLGSILATTPENAHPRQPRITDAEVARLESEIDEANPQLPPLRSFVLPGGARLNAELHVCRTVCRRAERLLVKAARTEQIDPVNIRYLNRLSDALFVWSRWASAILETKEVLWAPNESASGTA